MTVLVYWDISGACEPEGVACRAASQKPTTLDLTLPAGGSGQEVPGTAFLQPRQCFARLPTPVGQRRGRESRQTLRSARRGCGRFAVKESEDVT